MTRKDVMRALSVVVDPKRGRDIARMGLVRNLQVEGRDVSFTVHVTDEKSPFARQLEDLCRRAIRSALGNDLRVQVTISSKTKQSLPALAGPIAHHMIAVASGKGGVGKSTVAVNLAVALAERGLRTGLVDTDIYGPSVPTMFGVEDQKPRVGSGRKIIPLEKFGVRLLSMGLLVDPSQAVVWRGPMVSNAVRQFLRDSNWGTLDFLILDLPPGTGDIQLTIVQTVSLTGAVIVSTPQRVALADARKGVAMFNNVNVPVLGIIENMAYFSPPDMPDRRYYLFGESGARRLAHDVGVPFLGEIPLEQRLRESGDEGVPIVVAMPESESARSFRHVAADIVRLAAERADPDTPVEIVYR